MRNEHDEAVDREAEAEFWNEWDGKTGCAGQVAQMLILAAVLAHSLYHLITL